jgi:hypothetical protein
MAKIKFPTFSWRPIEDFFKSLYHLLLAIWNKPVFRYFCNYKRFIAYLVIFIVIVSVTFCFGIQKSLLPFEGQLTVSKLSFTSSQTDSLFLNNITNIKKITISGRQEFTLEGDFESPEFNEIKKLKIDLPEESSQWTITACQDKKSKLALRKLVLQENTHIRDLEYNTFGHNILFSLDSESDKDSNNPNQLIITPNSAPYKITLERYRLPDFPNLNPTNDSATREFYIKSTELNINLPKSGQLSISIDKPERRIFGSKLKVKDVNFETSIKTGTDNIIESTIKSGTIRLARQNLNLEPEQFLIIESPGVFSLRKIQILPKSGLLVQVSGQTERIEVGLHPEFPVNEIGGSWLEQNVSRDFYIAIITFCGVLIVELIIKLL